MKEQREILFRAWDSLFSVMIQPVCPIGQSIIMSDVLINMSYGDDLDKRLESLNHGGYEHYEMTGDFILEQYTGLEDRKGVKIFEGDILKICNGSINGSPWWEKNRLVVFSQGAFNVPIWSFDSTHWYEVIGNIHQNPDLL